MKHLSRKITFIHTLFSSLLLIFLACLLVLKQGDHSQRKNYEAFLLEQFKEIPQVRNAGTEEPKNFENPDLAAIQDYFMTMDPQLKRVPAERREESIRTTMDIKRKKNLETGNWIAHRSDMAGRVRTVMFDPTDPAQKKVWAGAVTGGLWYNNDITDPISDWEPVSDFWENLTVSSMAYDPNDSLTFYVGTGEPQTAVIIYRASSGRGVGIWKTTDGGNSWDLLPNDNTFEYISDIVVRDENGVSVIYAAVVSGTYEGKDHESVPGDGLYRSTDGGLQWEQVLPNIPGSLQVFAPSDIELAEDGRLYVGTMRNVDGKGAACILTSENGTDWTLFDDMALEIKDVVDPLYNKPGRVMISSAPSNPEMVYAAVSSSYPRGDFINYRAYTILKSTDGGLNWSKINMPDPEGDFAYLAWHAFIIEVDPNDPDVVYVGGLDQWKTEDGGATWRMISDWAAMYYGNPLENYVHADQHKVVFRNNSSDEVLFGTDGGVFYTTNATHQYITFQEKSRNLGTIQYYTCDIHPLPGVTFFVGGTQDNGTLNQTWMPMNVFDMVSGGDGAYCFIDDDQTVGSMTTNIITSIYYNGYDVYDYNSLIGNFTLVNEVYDNYRTSGIFINPADYDNKLNNLYANGMTFGGELPDHILRIVNIRFATGSELIDLGTNANVPFSHVKVSPYSPDGKTTLFLGTQSGRIYKVEEAQDFPDVSEIGSAGFPTANVSSVVVGESENELVVTFSNFGVPSVWYTGNGGSTWNDIEGNLPDMPVRWAINHPQYVNGILLATEVGLWESQNIKVAEVTWSPIGGFPNVRVDMLKYRESDKTVLAATHGRGFFSRSFSATGTGSMENPAIIRIYPNPSQGIFHIQGLDANAFEHLRITDMAGRLVFEKQISQYGSDERLVEAGHLPEGSYIITLSNNLSSTSQKLLIRK